jgi:hypothetical protein
MMKWNEFKNGINLIYKKWTGLQLAISDSDYDNAHSDLVHLTVEFFQETTVEIDELGNNLEAFVVEELGCELQDNSPFQVAIHVCELFKQLSNGRVEMYEKMCEELGTGSIPAVVESSDSDSDAESEPQEKFEPVIDEDGFELVQKTRRRR